MCQSYKVPECSVFYFVTLVLRYSVTEKNIAVPISQSGNKRLLLPRAFQKKGRVLGNHVKNKK